MPYWFAVFFLIYVPLVCLISVVAGAYLMWCREKQVNPLTSLRQFVPGADYDVAAKGREVEPGFYE